VSAGDNGTVGSEGIGAGVRSERRDIASDEDVAQLIRGFYGRCFEDDLLGPIFIDVAHLDLEAHLPVMVDFWTTVLFRSGAYRRNVLAVHVALHEQAPLTSEHLERWLELWTATVGDHFEGPVAQLAVTQARRFAWSMGQRLRGGSGSELSTVSRADLVIPLRPTM
jgi:hemoglobin